MEGENKKDEVIFKRKNHTFSKIVYFFVYRIMGINY